MRAYRLERFGDLETLVAKDEPEPTPGPGEALVRVRATSLNFRDILILNDRYAFPSKPQLIPVSDGAGEVVAVGPGVTRVAVGDRVAGIYFLRWFDGRLTPELAREQFGATRDGMLAEFVVASAESLVKVPAHLSFEEAATLPCAAVTAWTALHGPRPVAAGDTVLTVGTGGVALFALQLAKLSGARVIAIASSEEKVARVRALGADEAINSRATPEWDRQVLQLTDGRGAEHVVEAIGPDTLERSLRSTAFDGQLALMGIFASNGVMLDPRMLGGRALNLRRIAVGSRAAFEAMNRAIAQHRLKPVVDRVFPFSEAREAYRHVIDRRHFGKVVIAGA